MYDDPQISGILVQLPLPKHLNATYLLSLIGPDKDIDGLHEINIGSKLFNYDIYIFLFYRTCRCKLATIFYILCCTSDPPYLKYCVQFTERQKGNSIRKKQFDRNPDCYTIDEIWIYRYYLLRILCWEFIAAPWKSRHSSVGSLHSIVYLR